MDIKTGDTVKTKKTHPCGNNLWEITRVGMDVRLVCKGCGHEIMLPRKRAEKMISQIISE